MRVDQGPTESRPVQRINLGVFDLSQRGGAAGGRNWLSNEVVDR